MLAAWDDLHCNRDLRFPPLINKDLFYWHVILKDWSSVKLNPVGGIMQWVKQKIFTFLSFYSQCPCWGAAAPLVVMRLDLASQQHVVCVCLCAGLLVEDCDYLQLPLRLCEEPGRRQLIYVEQKSEMRLVSSVTTSFWTNHRKRGSWRWRKHTLTAATAERLNLNLNDHLSGSKSGDANHTVENSTADTQMFKSFSQYVSRTSYRDQCSRFREPHAWLMSS